MSETNQSLTAQSSAAPSSPRLHRELGLFDLTLMLVIAVVNVNAIPIIATEGWRSITLWVFTFILFLIPQAVSVAEFGKKYPGEGGVYLWTKEMYGDSHGFISGWCYWTNNLFYYPSVLFTLVGVLVYVGGPESASLAENKYFMVGASLLFLWLITFLHIRGLGIGKWLNNAGVVGTWFTLTILIVIAVNFLNRHGSSATPLVARDFLVSAKDYAAYSIFSVMIYSTVGLELGSSMGDEIKNTSRIIGKAAFLGGAISIVAYLLGTSSILAVVPAKEVGAIQGVMQAVTLASTEMKLTFMIPVVALLVSLAMLGVSSAWIGGAARIPFVMGLGVYLPPVLGKLHRIWDTPYIALIVQALVSGIFILISLFGSTVVDAYGILLKSSVVIQLIPFLYLFAGLWKLGKSRVWAVLGFLSTVFGMAFVFVPSEHIDNLFLYEAKIIAFPIIVMGVGLIFHELARRKNPKGTFTAPS
jgi:glutamate:GABA antiporter